MYSVKRSWSDDEKTCQPENSFYAFKCVEDALVVSSPSVLDEYMRVIGIDADKDKGGESSNNIDVEHTYSHMSGKVNSKMM